MIHFPAVERNRKVLSARKKKVKERNEKRGGKGMVTSSAFNFMPTPHLSELDRSHTILLDRLLGQTPHSRQRLCHPALLRLPEHTACTTVCVHPTTSRGATVLSRSSSPHPARCSSCSINSAFTHSLFHVGFQVYCLFYLRNIKP